MVARRATGVDSECAEALLDAATVKLGLSDCGLARVLSVSRTIAGGFSPWNAIRKSGGW
jgi:hypothetical protein